MPYIKDEDRPQYDEHLDKIKFITNKGHLEYCINKLQLIFMRTREWRYSNLHDAVYATEHMADEFRRRHLDGNEDRAILKNGDVTI